MPSRAVASLVGALLIGAVTGCGSADEPDPDSSSSSSSSTGPTGTPSVEPTPKAPEVEPASGERADLTTSLTLRVPADGDWYVEGGGSIFATAPVGGGTVDIGASDVLADRTSIDDGASRLIDTLDDIPGLTYRRAPDATAAGVEGWVIEGTGDDQRFHQFGTWRKGRIVTVDFTIHGDVAPALTEDLIASVLASIEWK